MASFSVHACTDITGFGLLGHLAEMIDDTDFGLEIEADRIPIISEAADYAAMGLVPAGAYKNREFREPMVDFSPSIDRTTQDILFDPQTSGGLMICVDADQAEDLTDALKSGGIDHAAVITHPQGEFVNPHGFVEVVTGKFIYIHPGGVPDDLTQQDEVAAAVGEVCTGFML